MSYLEIAGSKFLFFCVGIGLLIVTAVALYYLVVCYRHAMARGIKKETMMSVIKSSVSFSIIPSLAIVAGLITLSTVIGIAYSWLRLSVIGSVSYEIMAANMALTALGVDPATASGEVFGLVMFVMCLGITAGLLFNLFLVEKVHMKSTSLKQKDRRWGSVAGTVFMTSLLVVMVIPMFFSGVVSLLTFVTSMAITLGMVALAKKTGIKWISSFALVFSLVGAMASSLLWSNLFA